MAKSSRRGSFRGKVSHNASQQRSKASNYGHLVLPRGINVFEEEPGGRIALDILPYFVIDPHHPDRDDEREIAVEGSLWYRRPYKLHRSIGTDNKSVVCPSSIGRPCPICEDRARQLKAGRKWDDDEIKAMRPSDRNLYYVRPLGSKKHEEKPYLWDISQFCFQKALNDEIEENDEFGDFPDLEKGLTLQIRFAEKKIGTNSFAETSRIDFETRDYTYDEAVIGELPSLDGVLDVKDYREVERLFFESPPDDGDDGDGDSDGDGDIDADDRSRSRPAARGSEASAGMLQDEPYRRLILAKAVTTLKRPARSAEPTASPTAARRAPAPTESKTAGSATASSEADVDECPSGHRFGVDTDDKPECDECPVWNECFDAKKAAA